MAKAKKAIPEGYTAVTPHVVVNGAGAAIDFYKRAFGAEETVRMPGPDGKVMHGEIKIGGSVVMLCDENPERGAFSARTLKGTPVSLFLYVKDVDAVFKRALAAGATEESAVTDAFWGDRWGCLVDPFGLRWQVATHTEDLTPEEIRERASAAMSAP